MRFVLSEGALIYLFLLFNVAVDWAFRFARDEATDKLIKLAASYAFAFALRAALSVGSNAFMGLWGLPHLYLIGIWMIMTFVK